MGEFRKLKVHTKHQNRTWKNVTVPEIRLEGKWLAELGFVAGEHIQIEQQERKLIITPNKDGGKKSS